PSPLWGGARGGGHAVDFLDGLIEVPDNPEPPPSIPPHKGECSFRALGSIYLPHRASLGLDPRASIHVQETRASGRPGRPSGQATVDQLWNAGSFLAIALRMVMSFRMVATMASLKGFPLALRRR